MKIRKILKFALPILGIAAAVAIITPLVVTYCNHKKEAKITTTQEKLDDFTTNFNHLLDIKHVKDTNNTLDTKHQNPLVVFNFEQTVLEKLGIPQSLVQSFIVNNDFNKTNGLWKLEIQLVQSHHFKTDLVVKQKTTKNDKLNHYKLTTDKLEFYFESPFDYIALNPNASSTRNYFQKFVNQIPLIVRNNKPIFNYHNTNNYLDNEFKTFINEDNNNNLSNVVTNIKINDFKQIGKSNNWSYNLTVGVQSPFVFVDSSNEIQKTGIINNLTYSQISLDYNSFRYKFAKTMEAFASELKTKNTKEQFNLTLQVYQRRLSELLLNKSSGITFSMHQSRLGKSDYSLTIYLPSQYKIVNLPDPTNFKQLPLIGLGIFNNSIKWIGQLHLPSELTTNK